MTFLGKIIVFGVIYILANVANAQSKNSNRNPNNPTQNNLSENSKVLCQASESFIEEGLKTIAFENVSGIMDNSAPREANRQLKIVAAGNFITSQLIHMQTLQCPPLQWSISHSVFVSSALECSLAISRSEDYKDKCNRKNWIKNIAKVND